MKTELVEKNGKTKLIKLEVNGRTVQVALGLVNSTKKGPVVQADYFITQDGEKLKGWKKHGPLTELIQKHLDYRVTGIRQKFIDDLYFSC